MSDVFDGIFGQPKVRDFLRACVRGDRVSHAYLFTGPAGSNKTAAAFALAKAIVCEGDPCSSCEACSADTCRRIDRKSHPDVHYLAPEGAQGYVVEQIRELVADSQLAPLAGGHKVYILDRVDSLGTSAANAFLKTLEEPPERTVFFLITDQPAALLPTIVSRCRVVRFHPLTEEACAARLIALGQPPETAKKKARMAEGCVGRALAIDDGQLELRMALTRDVFSVHRPADVPGVVNLYKEDKERQKLVLDTLEIALRDILVQQAGGASVAGAGYAREAEAYARRTPLSGGLSLMETLRRARVMLAGNVAFASAFETILLQISEEYAKWPW